MLAGMLLFASLAATDPTRPGQGVLVAIDVLLEPGRKMLSEAAAWNARMRQQSPEGFALDAEHTPHVTLVQRYVAMEDLPKVLAAVVEVEKKFDLNFEMTATGIYHIPSGRIGLAGIVVQPSERLAALQQAIIEAVDDYSKSGGSQSAFVPDKSGAPFDPMLFKYVDTFVPGQTGAKYNPHVTIGIAPLSWLEALEKQPFEKFEFKASGIAVYQLGNFGTASKRLSSGD